MKRIILIAAILSTITLSSFAQKGIRLVQFGIKAGYTAETDKLKNSNFVTNTGSQYHLTADHSFGFHIGLVARVNLAMLHIQPELLYSLNKYKLGIIPAGGNYFNTRVKVQTLTVPILVGTKLAFVRFNAGPTFNIMTSTTNSASQPQATNVMVSTPAVGYMLGIGADLLKTLTLDIRYAGQFKACTQNLQIGNAIGQNTKIRMNQWQFSVGYLF